jgi:hypothetical protein
MGASEWHECYRQLVSAFGKKPDQAQSEAYFEALSSVPTPTLRLAVQHAIRECKHFPRVSELRGFCGAASRQTQAVGDQFRCEQCGGNTWVESAPREEHGLVYRNVVKRCACSPQVRA